MKNVKRLLSFVLALAMLLTMASFPAFAADYTYTPKTILLEASERTSYAYPAMGDTGSGPRLIRRPVNDVYVGDSFAIPEGGIKLAFATDYTGFKLSYGRSGAGNNGHYYDNDNHKVYVKIEQKADGAYMTGMYSTLEGMLAGDESTRVASRKFDAAGTVIFGIDTYYDSTGAAKAHSSSQGMGSTHNGFNATLFSLNVKAVPTSDPVATAPEKLVGLADASTAITLQRHSYYNAIAEGNLAYVERYTYTNQFNINPAFNSNWMYEINLWPHDGSAGDTSATATTSAERPCVNGYGFEFVSDTYVKEFKVNISGSHSWIVYDLYGSMDGTTWYKISDAVKSTASNNTHTIPVDAIVRYLRLDLRDASGSNYTSAIHKITEITGVENVPDSWTVTVDGLTSATLETDINGKVNFSSITTQFPTGDYVYKVDGIDVTEALANGTYAFTSNKTVTVDYAPYDYVPKTVYLDGAKYSFGWDHNTGGKYIFEAPTDDLYDGDKLAIKAGTPVVKPAVENNGSALGSFTADQVLGYKVFLTRTTFDSSKTYYYIGIEPDTDSSTGYSFTGLYATEEDMLNKTNPVEITLTRSSYTNLFSIGLAGMYYNNADTSTYVSIERTDNPYGWNKTYMWFFTIKEAPTTKNYENEAPAVLNGLADNTTELVTADFVTDPATADLTTQNLFGHIRANTRYHITEGEETNRDLVYQQIASTNQAFPHTKGFKLSFAADRVYLKDIKLNAFTGYTKFDVWGSLDGETWYKVSMDNEVRNNSGLTIPVNGIAKYFFFDMRATGTQNSYFGANGPAIIPTIQTANVVTNPKDSWTVTFTDGTTTDTVETDINGFYTVPEAFKGDVKYYADAEYTKLLNTAVPVKGNMTVYVKANTWEYTPKTVSLQEKLGATGDWNYSFRAPVEQLFVGDSITIDPAVFDSVEASSAYKGLDTAYSTRTIVGYDIEFTRLYDNASSEVGKYYKTLTFVKGAENDKTKATFDKAGIYVAYVRYVYMLDANGDPEQINARVAWNVNILPATIIEVNETPTSATAVKAPTTSETGTVTTLVAYNDSTAYTTDKASIFVAGTLKDDSFGSVDEINNVESIGRQVLNGSYTTNGLSSYLLDVQIDLGQATYVETLTLRESYNNTINDCAIYGSLDGENWYPLAINPVNTKRGNFNDFTVKGVARYLKATSFDIYGWANMSLQYEVKGYYLTGEVDKNPAPSWVKDDGTKTEITSTSALPVAYTSGSTNYAVTGWQMVTASGLVDVALADLANMTTEEIGDLHAVVTEIPVEASALTATLTAKGNDAGLTFDADRFINGFYVQGAQIRVPSGEGATAVKSGLRYVNILDNALITKLNELKSAGTVASYEFGTLAVSETKYVGGDLEIGATNVRKSVGEKLFADAGDFENAYFKYTVCITEVPQAHYATNIIVRPYLTINNTDGTSVTLYGEQYQTSVYSAAKFALDNDAELTTEEIAYLENVVDIVEG